MHFGVVADGEGNRIPLPDFITSARRELMESAVFLAFLTGAIAVLFKRLGFLELRDSIDALRR